MKTFNLSEYASASFKLTAEDCKNGIILKFNPLEMLHNDCVNISFSLDKEEEKELTEYIKGEDASIIPGHPNCRVGDCYDCHVVSCAIYQGYEEMP